MISQFSTILKELRKSKGLQQEQVAKLVGVNKNAISTYENDKRRPSFETLVRLADLFHVSTDYLLNRTSSRSLDLSNLSDHDAALVCDLVNSLKSKK